MAPSPGALLHRQATALPGPAEERTHSRLSSDWPLLPPLAPAAHRRVDADLTPASIGYPDSGRAMCLQL